MYSTKSLLRHHTRGPIKQLSFKYRFELDVIIIIKYCGKFDRFSSLFFELGMTYNSVLNSRSIFFM